MRKTRWKSKTTAYGLERPVIAAVDLLAHTLQKIILLLCGLEI